MAARLSQELPTWTELNRKLRNIHSEEKAAELLQQLRTAGANARWLRRASARFRKLRSLRERREFDQGLLPYKGPRIKKRRKVSEGELGRAVGFDFADEVNVTTLTDKKK